jgi:hypothetical protein
MGMTSHLALAPYGIHIFAVVQRRNMEEGRRKKEQNADKMRLCIALV